MLGAFVAPATLRPRPCRSWPARSPRPRTTQRPARVPSRSWASTGRSPRSGWPSARCWRRTCCTAGWKCPWSTSGAGLSPGV